MLAASVVTVPRVPPVLVASILVAATASVNVNVIEAASLEVVVCTTSEIVKYEVLAPDKNETVLVTDVNPDKPVFVGVAVTRTSEPLDFK